jgi:hypothetical protein
MIVAKKYQRYSHLEREANQNYLSAVTQESQTDYDQSTNDCMGKNFTNI